MPIDVADRYANAEKLVIGIEKKDGWDTTCDVYSEKFVISTRFPMYRTADLDVNDNSFCARSEFFGMSAPLKNPINTEVYTQTQ